MHKLWTWPQQKHILLTFTMKALTFTEKHRPARWGCFSSAPRWLNRTNINNILSLKWIKSGRRVEFRGDGDSVKPNTLFRQHLISINHPPCNFPESIAQFLMIVHKHKLCPGLGNGNHSQHCQQFLEEFKNTSGKFKVSRALRCIACKQKRHSLRPRTEEKGRKWPLWLK